MKSTTFIRFCACLVFAAALLASAAGQADARYQIVPLHPGYEFGTEKAMILDTVAGHLWI